MQPFVAVAPWRSAAGATVATSELGAVLAVVVFALYGGAAARDHSRASARTVMPGGHAQSEVIIAEESRGRCSTDATPTRWTTWTARSPSARWRRRCTSPTCLSCWRSASPERWGRPPSTWADARVWFTIFSLSVAVPSLLRMRSSPRPGSARSRSCSRSPQGLAPRDGRGRHSGHSHAPRDRCPRRIEGTPGAQRSWGGWRSRRGRPRSSCCPFVALAIADRSSGVGSSRR